MPDVVTRQCEGRTYVTSGSLICPDPERCEPHQTESQEAYVRRHCLDHNLGSFKNIEDAERNLGMWCFYYYDKFVWGNPELTPYPHWEIHAFVAESTWSETDLQHRTPLARRKTKGYLPPADKRRIGEYRRFKQIEVPRQCQKTSIGARAYSLFRAQREYFINDRRNYRIIIRSATGKNTRDTLEVIRRQATKNPKIAKLYGIYLVRCGKCGYAEQKPKKVTACPSCKSPKMLRHRYLSLLDDSRGAGSAGRDQISFRWLTNSADGVAAYNIWVAGLKTETTGQRPDLYIWDDPQTEKNSRTVEMRKDISDKFDGSVRELQFEGELLVFDTRKYIGDFAGKIGEEPLVSQFFSLRREVRWRTEEPDNAPWVVDGWRYYYPVRGDGQRALDAAQVANLKKQMRTFSAEYMNNPVDEDTALFKRSDFILCTRDPERANADLPLAPPEVRYGLGCKVSPQEQMDLDSLKVRINAMNAIDPAGDGKQKKTGDDNFIVGIRLNRHGRVYVTRLAAGHWPSKRRFSELEKAATYNMARRTVYELPVNEDDTKEAFEKWVRDKSEELSALYGEPTTLRPAITWEHMPKSSKDSRIDAMEQFLPIYILDDAADPDLIEKYISQWVGRGVEDHDDGPDATSALIPQFSVGRYKKPEEEAKETFVDPNDGAAYMPLSAIKAFGAQKAQDGLWGAGGVPVVRPGANSA